MAMTAPPLGGVDWPLVGRDGELRLLNGILSRPGARGLVLAGPAGVGKTRLAVEGLRHAEQAGMATAHSTATRATSTFAFGAVAPLLPAAETAPHPADHAELLRRFAAALAGRAEGRRLVFLVDDAHLLDDASATLVYQLALSGAACVLITVRSREPAPEPVVALWKDAALDRLELHGLDGEAIEDLLSRFLGGPVDRAAVAQLASRSEGNVLFLRELALGALATGSLADEGGLWRLTGPLAPSERLVELVESRLAGLDGDERALLEAVAVADSLGTAELAAVGNTDVAEALERKGLVQSHLDGRRLRFRLAHPLHGEVLRTKLSALRIRSLARTLAGSLRGTGFRREDDTLQLATWQLELGSAEAELMLAAASAARRRYDFLRAERLARMAIEAGAGFPAAVLAAQLTSLAGRCPEAEVALAALGTGAAGDDERGLVAATRFDNFRYMGRFDDARRVADEALAQAGATDWAAELVAKRAALLLETAGPAVAADALSRIGPEAAGAARAWACLFSAFAQSRTGRLDAAVAATDEGKAVEVASSGRELQWLPGVLALARAEALGCAGRLAEAESVAETEYRRALAEGSIDGQAYAAWQLAKVLLAQGRPDAAARHGREAAALLRQLNRVVLLRDCLVPLACAEALRGEADRAAEVLADLDGLGLPPSRWTGVDLLAARAWQAVAAGEGPAARALLEEAATLGAEVGDRVGEAAALHDLARLGKAKDVAERLASVAVAIDGDLAAARAAHAAALVRSDPAALVRVSESFEAAGALLLAAEAAADAAVAWRRQGDPRSAGGAERRSEALADRCGGASTPALAAVETRARLTPAERDVALLAAAGRSNRDIAAALNLSLRTVENRLHRVYEKLGVSGRPELAAAL